jgi:hypothetical protein
MLVVVVGSMGVRLEARAVGCVVGSGKISIQD